jgi:hypothetical protein
MSARRTFLAALLTLTAAGAGAPAIAAADAPVWQTPLIASGDAPMVANPQVMAATDGSICVYWEQKDSNDKVQIVARTRSAQGVWSEPVFASDTPGGVQVGGKLAVTAGDGSITLAWMSADYSATYIAVKQPGSTGWSVDQSTDAGEYFWGAALTTGPDDSTILLTTGGVETDHKLRVRQRAAGSDTFSVVGEIDQPDDEGQGVPQIAYNDSGDAVAAWRADVGSGGDREVRAARYDRETDTWSAPETVIDDPDTSEVRLAFNNEGAAAMLWVHSSQTTLKGYEMDAATGTWSDGTSLMVNGPAFVLPWLAADNDGQFVAAWQEMDFSNPGAAQLLTRTLSVVDHSWSQADQIGLNGFGGAPVLATNSSGDMVLSLVTTADGIKMSAAVALRESGSSGFDPVLLTPAEDVYAQELGVPAAAIDGDGNVLTVFPKSVGSGLQVGFVAGDASGPEIGATNVPASGTVGVPVRFTTTSPFDLWSAVASTSWAFGDGATAAGTSVLHTYTNPGRYRVSFLATDSSGFETQSEERYITIAPAPLPPVIDDEDEDDEDEDVPPPPRKKVDPPIIEARLSGRTITLKAKVTLRKGKRCTGKALATTKFGRRTYRTTLRLKNYGTTCRATGKIRLKKTPSTRTRLRIKIKNSNLKTRTITTKRA